MRPRLLNSLSLLSLLLCVAFVAVLVRTNSKPWHHPFQHRGQLWELSAYDGKVSIDNEPQIAAETVRSDALLYEQMERELAAELAVAKADQLLEKLTSKSDEDLAALRALVQKYNGPTSQPDSKTMEMVDQAKKNLEKEFAERDAAYDAIKAMDARVTQERASRASLPMPGPMRRDSLPTALMILALLVVPAIAYRRSLIQRIRRSAGVCVSCGYDLRATPERCPECGAVAGKR